MVKKYIWKNNGSENAPHYDLILPRGRGGDILTSLNNEIIAHLGGAGRVVGNSAGPVEILKSMPKEMQEVLLIEMRDFGNSIISISRENWPNENSIVVCLANKFSEKSKSVSKNVVWRKLSDPHYCEEEMSQNVEGTEYLLIN